VRLNGKFTLCFGPTDLMKNVFSDCLKWLYCKVRQSEVSHQIVSFRSEVQLH